MIKHMHYEVIDILYTADQYKELENAYQEICEELKEAKLGNIF